MSKLRIARATALAIGFFLSITIGTAPFAGAEEDEPDSVASPRKSYMPPERGGDVISERQPVRARISKVTPKSEAEKRRIVVPAETLPRKRYPAAGLPTIIRPTSKPASTRARVITISPTKRLPQAPRVVTGVRRSELPHTITGVPRSGMAPPHRVVTALPPVASGSVPRVITALQGRHLSQAHDVATGLPGAVRRGGPRMITGLPENRLPLSRRVITGLPGVEPGIGPRVITGLHQNNLPRSHRVITVLPGTSLSWTRRVTSGLPESRTRHSAKIITGLTANRHRRTLGSPTGLPKTRARGQQSNVTVFGPIRVTRYGTRGRAKAKLHHRHGVRIHLPRFAAFALPEQTLYPPYYRSSQPWTHRPDLKDRLGRSYTARRGSPLRSHMKAGRTVEQGAVTRSHIKGGRTDRKGSPLRSRLVAGRTVQKGSRWSSTMGNWTFRGYQAPMRPRGIPYYRPRW